jgi:hypothetical protein
VSLELCSSDRETPPFGTWQDSLNSDADSEKESARWAVLLGRYLAKE